MGRPFDIPEERLDFVDPGFDETFGEFELLDDFIRAKSLNSVKEHDLLLAATDSMFLEEPDQPRGLACPFEGSAVPFAGRLGRDAQFSADLLVALVFKMTHRDDQPVVLAAPTERTCQPVTILGAAEVVEGRHGRAREFVLTDAGGRKWPFSSFPPEGRPPESHRPSDPSVEDTSQPGAKLAEAMAPELRNFLRRAKLGLLGDVRGVLFAGQVPGNPKPRSFLKPRPVPRQQAAQSRATAISRPRNKLLERSQSRRWHQSSSP
jgi:hypothetical protein